MKIGGLSGPLNAGFLCVTLCPATLAQSNGGHTIYSRDKGGRWSRRRRKSRRTMSPA